MVRNLRLINVDKHVAIASGEKYPALGILLSRTSVRSPEDERNLGNVGNGTPSKSKKCRYGADPPKKALGSTGAISSFDSTPS
jgi:hypothetical protein